MHDLKVSSVHIDDMEWIESTSPITGKGFLNKILVSAENGDGIDILYMIYPKGYKTVWHTHHCSHGIFVLEGTLKTHEGLYGPGTFVWFPEGILHEHGATDEEDVKFLFITNKAFDIAYCGSNYEISYKK